MNDRLFPAPADPDTLTHRQLMAYEVVRRLCRLSDDGTVVPRDVGYTFAAHWYRAPHLAHAKAIGLSVLRELHRKGLVRRVGRGGGRWTLSEEGKDSGGEATGLKMGPGANREASAPSSLSAYQTDDIPY